MLNENMRQELQYFAAMAFFGALAAACYHLLLVFRAWIRHGISLTDAEDILFFTGAGVGFFLVSYRMNDGILRWYAFFSCFLGVVFYAKTVGRMLETVRKWLLQKQKKHAKIRAKKKHRDGGTKRAGFAEKSKQKTGKKKNGTASGNSSSVGRMRHPSAREKRIDCRPECKADTVQ